MVILDEWHMARNKQSGVHRTLTWLDADFYLYAIFVRQQQSSFCGYIPFLFSPKPIWDELEDEDDLELSTTHPFEVPDDHHAAIGRFTSEARRTRTDCSNCVFFSAGEDGWREHEKILQELMNLVARTPPEFPLRVAQRLGVKFRSLIVRRLRSNGRVSKRRSTINSPSSTGSFFVDPKRPASTCGDTEAYRSLVSLIRHGSVCLLSNNELLLTRLDSH